MTWLRSSRGSSPRGWSGEGTEGRGRGSGLLGRPALLETAEPPHRHGDRPGHQEQSDDGEADVPEVQRGRPDQGTPVEPEPLDEQAGEDQAPDDEGDGDREQRDGEVVEDLADRL